MTALIILLVAQLDLSGVSEADIIKTRAHAAQLRGNAEAELVKSMTELSGAQVELKKAAQDKVQLDQEISKLEKYSDEQEAAKDKAVAELAKEKEHSAKIARFAHWMLTGIWGFCFVALWQLFGKFSGPAGLTPPLVWWRLGACVVAASGTTYAVFHFLSRL